MPLDLSCFHTDAEENIFQAIKSIYAIAEFSRKTFTAMFLYRYPEHFLWGLPLASCSRLPDCRSRVAECLVISLLYIERIRSLTGLRLCASNWQPILLAAMIVAQKVWDDKSLLNVDFSVSSITCIEPSPSVSLLCVMLMLVFALQLSHHH
jgi:hypothetical protein